MYDLKKATLTCRGSHIYVCTFCTNDDYDSRNLTFTLQWSRGALPSNLLRHFATGNDRDVIITRVVNEHLGAGSEIPYLLSSLYSLFQ